jgi:beta-phosphoglucomutase-like phosphatase (HAD superfamily)
MNIAPSHCVVIEDAVNGVEAAKAAGMRCVAVETSFPASALCQADCIRPSVASVTIPDLLGGVFHV